MMEEFIFAKDLPADWDDKIADNIYLKRDFLKFLEGVDDTVKRYYIFRGKDGKIDTQFVTHIRHNYNLTMFTKLKSNISMTFVYIPVSVAKPAMIYGDECAEEVSAFLRSIKGYKLILNMDEHYALKGFTKALTCPDCRLNLQWDSFEGYMSSLRSNYRYRYNKALKRSAQFKMYAMEDNSAFNEELYSLYEQVFENSPYKLEKLSIDFFS